MCIERAFGKFKSQWPLFGVSATRFYPKEMGHLFFAVVILHNITIDIDNAGWHPSYQPSDIEVEVPVSHDTNATWNSYSIDMKAFDDTLRNSISNL